MTEFLADRQSIVDVITRYATSIDKRDLERYATCFVDDVEVTGFSFGPMIGVKPYVAAVAKALTRFGCTHHLLGNHEIEITGETAHMRTYIQATHVLASDPDTLLVLWAIYDDQLVRTNESWKIKKHHLDVIIPARKIHSSQR
jgi:3-phenylpropionate/cinnamic acid dioxygenase small subunit